MNLVRVRSWPTPRLSAGALALLLVLIGEVALAQLGSDWRSHTPMRQARALAVSSEAVWGGTSGGLFRRDRETGDVQRYTTVEGLSGIDVRALAIDEERSHLWVGYPDGSLDRLDVESGSVTAVRAIERADRYSDRSVHALAVEGDSLLVGTGFGVVVVDVETAQVRDSYVRFGPTGRSVIVRDLAVGSVAGYSEPRLWLATTDGLAHASVSHPNLRDPGAWTLESVPGAGGPLRALALHEGDVYVGAPDGGFVRRDDGFGRVWGSEDEVRDLVSTSEGLVGVFRFALRRAVRDDRIRVGEHSNLQALAAAPDGRYWVADEDRGIAGFADLLRSGTVEITVEVVPEGPYHGLFRELEISDDGSLWAAGAPDRGTGFYRLGGDGWTNYTRRFVDAFGERDGFDVIEVAPDGSVWAGSRGDGLARLAPDGSVEVFDAENSALRPAPGTGDYIRISGIAAESDGTTWVSNLFADPSLVVRDAAGSWHGLPHLQTGPVLSSSRFERIHVDRVGLAWLGLRRVDDANEGRGLAVFDDGGTPASSGDDRIRVVREGGFNAGLPDNTVTAFAEDAQGRVWVGTEDGLAFFTSSSAVLAGGPGGAPQWPVREGELFLNDLVINDIAVDPAGRKWLATPEGAWLIDPTATELILHLTPENSPLFSQNVVAVTVDPATGRVYFATDAGMLSVRGSASRPAETAGALKVYPNPVETEALGTAGLVTIEGLVAASQVRIVTPSGRLVASFQAESGRIQWDGTDQTGRAVQPGMYLIVATGDSGGSSFGKLAVTE